MLKIEKSPKDRKQLAKAMYLCIADLIMSGQLDLIDPETKNTSNLKILKNE